MATRRFELLEYRYIPAHMRRLVGRASPHWIRHTRAPHSLSRSAKRATVRDNLRHAWIATNSIDL
jgi:site-specific recombinase XerC